MCTQGKFAGFAVQSGLCRQLISTEHIGNKYRELPMSKFMALLVEDDPLQRVVLADILTADGFEVLECATGEAAELIIATSGAEFRAVVTDQNLEGSMRGSELAAF